MKISLLIVALNEVTGMKLILPRIKKEWVDEILIVDGGSTDGSVEYATSLGFKVLRQQNRLPLAKRRQPIFPNHSAGVVEGLREGFAACTGDFIITFSPDNNCVPERIPDLVAKIRSNEYDMVVVSRYLGDAKSTDDTFLTGLGNWGLTQLVNVLFGAKYTDLMGIFRAYRKSLPLDLGINLRLSFHTDLAIRCKVMGKKTFEIPGDEPARIGGQTIRNNVKNGMIELYTILESFYLFKIRGLSPPDTLL